MASQRQFAANRRNAARSTGPRTEVGKLRSRQNACRHGLTAETVIPSLEDVGDYQALEQDLTAEHCPGTRLEQELVARLASLLWRLRRATLIETGLLEMQGAALQQHRRDEAGMDANSELSIFYKILLGAPAPFLGEPRTGAAPAASDNQNQLFVQLRKMDIASAYASTATAPEP
jgi:hypothetical protein